MDGPAGRPRLIGVPEAARVLGVTTDAVQVLTDAGWLRPADGHADAYALGDLKALLARVDGGEPELWSDTTELDPTVLLDALDGRAADMAARAHDVFVGAFPEAASWSTAQRDRFVAQARSRFEAILAVTAHGDDVDLTTELGEVGAAAAWSGSSLPQLLVVLRISRDLVVHTAVEVAEERGRHWGLALALVLTRVLPTMDRLTDAIASGYWAAVVRREEEHRARHESVVEHASDGVYELDLEGRIRYANPALAIILGRPLAELEGARVSDLVDPGGGQAMDLLTAETRHPGLAVRRPDGVRRVLDVRTLARREGGVVVGWQGMVRDVTAAAEVEASRREVLAGITGDLDPSLTELDLLGARLERAGAPLSTDDAQRLGASLRAQASRLRELAGDLDGVQGLDAADLSGDGRTLQLSEAVAEAVSLLPERAGVEQRVDRGLLVHADPAWLGEVLAALLGNALRHGAPPVVVSAGRSRAGVVELMVADAGPGVPDDAVEDLFTYRRRKTDRSGGGLSSVRAMVEAMGGRVGYRASPGGGGCFEVALPTPPACTRRD